MPFFVSSKELDELESRARRAELALVKTEASLDAERKRTSPEWKAIEMLRAKSEASAKTAAAERIEAEASRRWILQREGDIAQLRQSFLEAIQHFRTDSSDLK